MKLDLNLFKVNKKNFLRKMSIVILGNLLSAISIMLFLRPNDLMSGGATGLAILFNKLFGTPVGLVMILVNIPLLFIGYRYLNKQFIYLSIVSIALLSFFVTILEPFENILNLNNTLLAAVFGGIIGGTGMGIIFRDGGSQGGLDIVGAIFKKTKDMNIGSVMMGFNLVIILISSFVFSLEKALFTLISLYISFYVLDKIQTGLGIQKQVFIVSKKSREIALEIQTRLGRGVTFLEGEGAWTKEDRRIIFCVIGHNQVVMLRQIISLIDESAFMTVSHTVEVLGRGFKRSAI